MSPLLPPQFLERPVLNDLQGKVQWCPLECDLVESLRLTPHSVNTVDDPVPIYKIDHARYCLILQKVINEIPGAS